MKKILSKTLGISAIAALCLAPASAMAAPNDDAILMSVNGEEFVSETTDTIAMETITGLTNPTIVPGDELFGTLGVQNNGESDGTLKAYIIDVENNGPDDISMDDWFTGDIQVSANGQSGSLVYWDAQNGGEATTIPGTDYEGIQFLETYLAQGASTNVELSLEFPVEATSGNRAGGDGYGAGARSAEFDVYLTLEGDTDDVTPVEPTVPTTPDNGDGTDNNDDDTTDNGISTDSNDSNNSTNSDDDSDSATSTTNNGNSSNTGSSDSESSERGPLADLGAAINENKPEFALMAIIVALLGAIFIILAVKRKKPTDDETDTTTMEGK